MDDKTRDETLQVKSIRFRRLDWPYASTLFLTLGSMLALMLWARQVPLAKADARFADLPEHLIDVALPDPELRMEAERALARLDARPGPARAEVTEKERPAGPAETLSERERAEQKVTGRGLVRLLVAKGPGGSHVHPALADVFSEGMANPLGERPFENIAGVELAMAPDQRRRPDREFVPGPTDLEDLATPGETTRLKKVAKAERRLVEPGPVEVENDPSEQPAASRRPGDIVRVVQRRIGGIKHCYERRLLRYPETRGKITVRFEIHPGGRVLVVEVMENTTGDETLAACVARRVKAIRFPPAGGDTTGVTYPFLLEAGE